MGEMTPSKQALQLRCAVTSVSRRTADIFVLSFHAPAIASTVQPGQFVNIKVNDALAPLLRRPFSVYRTEGDQVEILFNVAGEGTRILSEKRPGDAINVLGPLGCGYRIDRPAGTALLVGGGLGVAPFPLLASCLARSGTPVKVFLGARSRDYLVTDHLGDDVTVATDDGTAGYHGTVVACLEEALRSTEGAAPRIFACGPNRMLDALTRLAAALRIPCELSLESAMACGIGICQGCPVEMAPGRQRFTLICKTGPVFDARELMEGALTR